MGLDSVQIIVETENCFEIEIENYEAESILTVGDLVNCVWSKIEPRDSKACLTQILFFRIRKFFCENLNIKPSQFKPNSHFSEFGKKDQLKALWSKLESDLKLKLPTVFTGESVFIFFMSPSDTVLDLIDGIIYKNFEVLNKEYGISKDAVFSIIASITHEIVGAPRESIISTAKFVDDLGIS
jgi:hypothetical protein